MHSQKPLHSSKQSRKHIASWKIDLSVTPDWLIILEKCLKHISLAHVLCRSCRFTGWTRRFLLNDSSAQRHLKAVWKQEDISEKLLVSLKPRNALKRPWRPLKRALSGWRMHSWDSGAPLPSNFYAGANATCEVRVMIIMTLTTSFRRCKCTSHHRKPQYQAEASPQLRYASLSHYEVIDSHFNFNLLDCFTACVISCSRCVWKIL